MIKKKRPETEITIQTNGRMLHDEKIAKEKNYVVAINSVYDGTKEIDIPGDIAAFAFDYGAWIAYQADREVITKTIVGWVQKMACFKLN